MCKLLIMPRVSAGPLMPSQGAMHDNGHQGEEMQPCHDLDGPEASRCINTCSGICETGPREMPSVIDVAVHEGTQGHAQVTCLREWD